MSYQYGYESVTASDYSELKDQKIRELNNVVLDSEKFTLGGSNRANEELLTQEFSKQNRNSTLNQVQSASRVGFTSELEQLILRSQNPININETEEISANGQRGIWANKQEVLNWRGVVPINQYLINEDRNPQIITKKAEQSLNYVQELAIRYLRPPTPPVPGDILIQQLPNVVTTPAPPLIMRQQPARPSTPEPLIIREAPPEAPVQVGKKIITISGKQLPPPPRKVIIERLAPLPSKPQSIIVERWLPYSPVKRRVVFKKSNKSDSVVVKPRNIVIQWDSPDILVQKELKYLGVIKANPHEYVQKFGSQLKAPKELPDFVLNIKTPEGLVLAAEQKNNQVHELEGEIEALRLIDFEKEGLEEYKQQVEKSENFKSFKA